MCYSGPIPQNWVTVNLDTTDNDVAWWIYPWYFNIQPGDTGNELCRNISMRGGGEGTVQLTAWVQGSKGSTLQYSEVITFVEP